MQLNGINPLVPMFWILSPQIPNTIIDTDVQSTFIKLMRLQREREKTPIRLIHMTCEIEMTFKNENKHLFVNMGFWVRSLEFESVVLINERALTHSHVKYLPLKTHTDSVFLWVGVSVFGITARCWSQQTSHCSIKSRWELLHSSSHFNSVS